MSDYVKKYIILLLNFNKSKKNEKILCQVSEQF